MPQEGNLLNVGELLGHPVILQGAWMRVKSWYARGELAPQPELSLWQLHPERMLSEVSELLRNNEWSPERWLQVPFPKKGQRLRHYLMPTVRDQVAFMAHLVLLGPILDQQTANFAFGNRWYRPILWDRRNEPPQWIQLRYPVLNSNTYLPYARSHGLFRRAAHWTVARMTGAPLSEEGESSSRPQFDDYDPDSLPCWTRASWWKSTGGTSQAYWAALDIELAFPSVRIERLEAALRQAMSRNTDVSNLFEGCPQTVVEALEEKNVRIEIGQRLILALRGVTVENSCIPRDSWHTPNNHPLPKIIADPYQGLPTGLIISGMLLNVVLQEPDRIVQSYLSKTREENPAAIVRFADDMYVLARSRESLFALIEVVHGALSGSESKALATPNHDSNLCINFQKIQPDPVQSAVGFYLKRNGWRKCGVCKQPLPRDGETSGTTSISNWLSASAREDKLTEKLRNVDRTAIGRGDIGPFVTHLVERMSDMGQDTLRQRFGEGARDYLARLHEMTLFNIEDEQVRADTRRMFSINRLVRAWLPRSSDTGEESGQLQRILRTISFAVETMPWKFSVWRSIVRASARRPHTPASKSNCFGQYAEKWLAIQLGRIASSTGSEGPAAWINAWPEADTSDAHTQKSKNNWRALYLSYLRSAFWHAFADVVLELRRHSARWNGKKNDIGMPSPHLWTVRSVPEGSHGAVADSLSDLDKWVCVLYPEDRNISLQDWPWELNEFVRAVLAIHPTTELADAWRATNSPKGILQIPQTRRLRELPHTCELLRRSQRLQETLGSRRSRKLDLFALAQVRLGNQCDELADVLFPERSGMRISRREVQLSEILAVATNLGCFKRIGLQLAREVAPTLSKATRELSWNVLLFQDYLRARRVIVGQHVCKVEEATVHRILWGRPCNKPLDAWDMVPWETPAVGLPSRVVATLFVIAREQSECLKWDPKDGPLTWKIKDKNGVLATGRRRQFTHIDELEEKEQTPEISRTKEWEVRPNAAFLRPFLVVDATKVCTDSYVLYCDVLLMLTLLDGGEWILDGLATQGIRGIPFEDRWAWRSRIHLPRKSWTLIEEILRWSDNPTASVSCKGTQLVESLKEWSDNTVKSQDFLTERIDVGLDPGAAIDVVRTISSSGVLSELELPQDLNLDHSKLNEQLLVRVGQTNKWPEFNDVVDRFPQISSRDANAMIEQVCNVFLAPAQIADQASPDMVVLPELAIPQQEVRSLRDLVRSETKGAVAGLYWRVVRPPFAPSTAFTPHSQYVVNEAELILPVKQNRGPTSVRWFRVQKPVPAHIEDGLTRRLSKNRNNCWTILRGRRWYRFVHPQWGDFSIAICADLIDSAPWRALRSDLLHLFMVAFNKDVELFDSLTWIRAYENYINVASVNHGKFGGSFIWTPRSKHGRELARLRGSELVLTADIQLPVSSLYEAQTIGVKTAIENAALQWANKKTNPSEFKAPPPGFRPRKP